MGRNFIVDEDVDLLNESVAGEKELLCVLLGDLIGEDVDGVELGVDDFEKVHGLLDFCVNPIFDPLNGKGEVSRDVDEVVLEAEQLIHIFPKLGEEST